MLDFTEFTMSNNTTCPEINVILKNIPWFFGKFIKEKNIGYLVWTVFAVFFVKQKFQSFSLFYFLKRNEIDGDTIFWTHRNYYFVISTALFNRLYIFYDGWNLTLLYDPKSQGFKKTFETMS